MSDTKYEGPVEIEGHLFLFMPAPGFLDEETSNRWVSCLTCKRKLARDADPAEVVAAHVAGAAKGVPTNATRVLCR